MNQKKSLYNTSWGITASKAFNLVIREEQQPFIVAASSNLTQRAHCTDICSRSFIHKDMQTVVLGRPSQVSCLYQALPASLKTVPMTPLPCYSHQCGSLAYDMGLEFYVHHRLSKVTITGPQREFLSHTCVLYFHIVSISMKKPIWQRCEVPC